MSSLLTGGRMVVSGKGRCMRRRGARNPEPEATIYLISQTMPPLSGTGN